MVEALEKMFQDDIATNKTIGLYGAECILGHIGQSGVDQVRILTHCNTGSLATAGYGTALGNICLSICNARFCFITRAILVVSPINLLSG